RAQGRTGYMRTHDALWTCTGPHLFAGRCGSLTQLSITARARWFCSTSLHRPAHTLDVSLFPPCVADKEFGSPLCEAIRGNLQPRIHEAAYYGFASGTCDAS